MHGPNLTLNPPHILVNIKLKKKPLMLLLGIVFGSAH